MPTRRVHLKFDEYLKAHGILLEDTHASSVHKRMDKGVKRLGSLHQLGDWWHSERGVREWVRSILPVTTSQDRKTDYVRIALGHKVLDEMAYRRPDLSENELIKAAYRSFVARSYHRKYSGE